MLNRVCCIDFVNGIDVLTLLEDLLMLDKVCTKLQILTRWVCPVRLLVMDVTVRLLREAVLTVCCAGQCFGRRRIYFGLLHPRVLSGEPQVMSVTTFFFEYLGFLMQERVKQELS